MPQLVMVDSGGSNLTSVQAALHRMGVEAPLCTDWDSIRQASHVLLPGVGAAGPAMAKLREHALHERLKTLQQPVLGICVGMQLLFEHSAEGDVACLGLLPGRVERLLHSAAERVPHMGWNTLHLRAGVSHPLLEGLDAQWAYYVHSFAAPVAASTLATCVHGAPFTAVCARDNFFGAQFHPERSASAGRRLFENFLRL